jgi:hypothetical protein
VTPKVFKFIGPSNDSRRGTYLFLKTWHFFLLRVFLSYKNPVGDKLKGIPNGFVIPNPEIFNRDWDPARHLYLYYENCTGSSEAEVLSL